MKNDHCLLLDDGFRSDGIEEEIIFGQDTWDNQAKLDFSPIGSTSFSFDRRSPYPVGIEKEPIVQKARNNLRSDGLDSYLDLLRNSVIEKELIAQMIRENLKPDGLVSSNFDHLRNFVIEKEPLIQETRKNLKSNVLDSSNLDLLRNRVIENEPIAQQSRKNLTPRHSSKIAQKSRKNLEARHSSNFDRKRNIVIEKEVVVQEARKNLKFNVFDSSKLDLLRIEKVIIAQMIRENLKPDGLDSANLDHPRNIVIEKEPVVQKTRKKLKYNGLDPSNLNLQRNDVIEKEPIAQKTRKKLKPCHSSNLDPPKNIVVEKEPIAENSRSNFKYGGFDSNLGLSRSTAEHRPGIPATRLQLKVSLGPSSLPVKSDRVIATPLCRTVNASSLENRASSDPKNPKGTNKINECSDKVGRADKGFRLNRRCKKWRKKEVSPVDEETSTRTKMKLHLPQIRSVRRRGDSKASVKVDDKYVANHDMNSLAKTTAPTQGNAGAPRFHDNEGSAFTKIRSGRRRGAFKVSVKVHDKYGDNDDMNRPAKTTAPTQGHAGAPANHDNEGSAFTKIALRSTVNAKSVRGSEKHPTAAGQLKNATVASSRLKWLWPKRNDGKIEFSNIAGKEKEVADFEDFSDCELNAISVSYTDVSEGVDIWRPRRKHVYVRRDSVF
jgi:hypothetical protein